jgi:hypothetical protein
MMFNRLKNSNWSRYVVTLIIGGLLVSLGYLIGDSAPSVEAQDGITRFDTIQCNGLIVSDGNPEHGSMWLGIIEEQPALVILDHADPTEAKTQIQISVGHDIKRGTESAGLSLINNHDDGSAIGIFAGRGETAVINVSTKKRINDAFNLWIGAKGSAMMLEGDTIQARDRVK